MIPAYCINLARRPDRWARMTDLAQAHGFEVTRVEATDARDPAQLGPLPRAPGPILDTPILPGDLACSLSHRRVWQMIVDRGHEAAIVLEDDCVFAEGFAAFLDPGWLPPDAKVVRLETTMLSARYGPLRPLPIPGRQIAAMRSRHTGAAATVITRAGAAFLLKAVPQFRDPVDQVLYNDRSALFSALAPLQVFPAPAIQGQILHQDDQPDWATSEIATERDGFRAHSVRSGRQPLRRGARKLLQRALGTEKIVVPFG